MRSRETLLRLHRFRTEDRRRQLEDVDSMIVDLKKKFDELDAHVKFEEGRNGITDPNNVNYSMTAKAGRTRRDNLLKSIGELNDQRETIFTALQEEQAELRKAEMLVEKEATNAQVAASLHAAHA